MIYDFKMITTPVCSLKCADVLSSLRAAVKAIWLKHVNVFAAIFVFSSDDCEDTEIINDLSVPTMKRPLWILFEVGDLGAQFSMNE